MHGTDGPPQTGRAWLLLSLRIHNSVGRNARPDVPNYLNASGMPPYRAPPTLPCGVENVSSIVRPPSGTRLAPDALGADHDPIEVALLGYGRPVVVVVLEHHGVDAVRAEGAEPVEARFLGLQGAVDPVLEHAIGLPGVVELDMRLDTIPLAHMAGVEERRPAVRGPEPREVRAIVVARGQDVPRRIGAPRRVQLQRVRGGPIAPHMRDRRLRPVGRRKDGRPHQLVEAAAQPARLSAEGHPPEHLPVDGPPRVRLVPAAHRRLPHRHPQRTRFNLPLGPLRPHPVGSPDPYACDPLEAFWMVPVGVAAEPIFLEVVTPDPARLRGGTLVHGRGACYRCRRAEARQSTDGLVSGAAEEQRGCEAQLHGTPPA